MTVILTPQSRHNVTSTNQSKQGGNTVLSGSPIGLLLALTYATFIGTVITPQSRHNATLTNQVRH